MSTRTSRALDPSLLAPRSVRLARAAVLLVFGLAITFTATLHEDFAFVVAIASSALAIIGAVHVIEWSQRRRQSGAPVALVLGIVSIAAAVLVFTIRIELTFAIVLAVWSLVCALLEFLGMTVTPGSRPEGALIGAAGVLLAIAILLTRNDLVAVIGFFGGYAVLAGVFLGIAAFDVRRSRGGDGALSYDSQPVAEPVESER